MTSVFPLTVYYSPFTVHHSLFTGRRGLFAADLDAELLREIRTSTHGRYAIGREHLREQIEHALHQRATPSSPLWRPGDKLCR